IAFYRAFDLDDLSAQIAKQHTAVGPSQRFGPFDNAYAIKRLHPFPLWQTFSHGSRHSPPLPKIDAISRSNIPMLSYRPRVRLRALGSPGRRRSRMPNASRILFRTTSRQKTPPRPM